MPYHFNNAIFAVKKFLKAFLKRYEKPILHPSAKVFHLVTPDFFEIGSHRAIQIIIAGIAAIPLKSDFRTLCLHRYFTLYVVSPVSEIMRKLTASLLGLPERLREACIFCVLA